MNKHAPSPKLPALSVRRYRRAARAVETFGNAAEAIGPVCAGMPPVFLLTRGQFSMLDMVLHVLNQVGRAHVSLWTWAIADYEVEAMHGLMGRGEILSARLVVDRSAEHRDNKGGKVVGQWRAKFGPESVRVCKNHAKIARVWTEPVSKTLTARQAATRDINADNGIRVLLRGSMNLNFNPRFEQADVTEGGPDFDLVSRVENELPILPPLAGNDAANAASGLGRLYTDETLQPFDGVKPWAK